MFFIVTYNSRMGFVELVRNCGVEACGDHDVVSPKEQSILHLELLSLVVISMQFLGHPVRGWPISRYKIFAINGLSIVTCFVYVSTAARLPSPSVTRFSNFNLSSLLSYPHERSCSFNFYVFLTVQPIFKI